MPYPTSVYGYAFKRRLNKHGLLELKEVTFASTPENLRMIAKFRLDMAVQMEIRGIEKFSHRHIDERIRNWRELCPNTDVIVTSACPGAEMRGAIRVE